MAKYLIEDSTLTAISNAIRTKTGKSELLKPSQWAVELDDIKVSGKYLWSKKESADGDVIGYAVDDDSTKYPDGAWQDGYYWECVGGEIEFTINVITFKATAGMTWGEWTDSDYVNGFMVNSSQYIVSPSGTEVEYNGTSVLATDKIINGRAYTYIVGSGGSDD